MGKSGPRNVKNVSLVTSWLPPGMYMYIWWSSTNFRSNHTAQIVCYSNIVNTQEWGFSIRKENENGKYLGGVGGRG